MPGFYKEPVEIKVIDSNEVNAFALPGGHLYINRGVIETADNEAELAGVIAHETGHVAARHGVEQASKASLINYGSIPLIFLGGIGGFAIRQAAGLAVPLGFLKFSRGMEGEADRLGAQYMWSAGYDPHAMVTFFEKLEAKEKKKPGTIWGSAAIVSMLSTSGRARRSGPARREAVLTIRSTLLQ